MPRFDFFCPKCQHQFEATVPRIGGQLSNAMVYCPGCRTAAARQLSSPAVIQIH